MEKKMEPTVVHWGYMGIMEKKMETTGIMVVFYRDYRVYIGVTAAVLVAEA